MRKLLICILCFAVTQSYAQLRLGVEGSFSSLNLWQSQGYSGLPSGVNTRAMNGFQAGIVAEYDLGHTNLILQPAVLYAENGALIGNSQGFPSAVGNLTIGYSNTTIKLYSVRVPVNLLYKWEISDKIKVLGGLGPYFAKHVSGTEKGYYQADFVSNGGYVTIKYPIDNKVKFESGSSSSVQGVTRIQPFDIGMDVEIGAQYKKFQFMINYSRGFSTLYHTNYVNAGNSFWNLTLAYLIFGHDRKPKL